MTTITDQTITKLTRELTSGDVFDRFDAASLIGIHRVSGAADALVSRLGAESDCQVRERITWATVQVIDAALPGVLRQLVEGDEPTRKQAAHVLSKTGRPEFAELLADVVNDPDPDVAIKGYRAASQTGNPAVLPMLAARLGDGDALQKDQLTNALVVFGTDSVDVLVAALADEDAAVRAHAAESLGYLGREADPALAALVTATTDADEAVRVVATSALGQLGEVADEPLAALATGSEATLARIATSLQRRRAAIREQAA